MRLLNTKDPDDAIKLYPWFVPTETESRMDITCELVEMMKTRPDDVFVLVAIENSIAKAMMVAHVDEKRKRTVWIWQAQSSPGFEHSQTMFDGLIEWAKGKKARYIRMGVLDDTRGKFFARRYGFKRNGRIMQKYIGR